MSQGFPDFEGSTVARTVAAEAMKSGEAALNQYSPQPGLLVLRQAIAGFQQRRYRAKYDAATEVIVTAGAQEVRLTLIELMFHLSNDKALRGAQALAAVFAAFLDPGEEVVLFEPFYPFMLGAVRLAGAIPRVVTLRAEAGFAIKEEELRAALRDARGRAKVLVLNSPHNPTGHVASAAELQAVARVCIEHDLLAVADEVYEHCVFPGLGAHAQLAAVEGMRERTITLGSGGKLFSLTGWRVSWAMGPAALLRHVGAAHTHMTFCAPTPLQAGVAAALDADDGLAAIAPLFHRNFEKLASALLAGTSISRVCPAQGGYFLVAETDGTPDINWCMALAEEKGVVCTPMSVFYASDIFAQSPCTLVRFTVCKSRGHMERACAAIEGT